MFQLTPNYTMRCFLEDRSKWDKHGGSNWHGVSSNNHAGDTKRRRKTPPPTGQVSEGEGHCLWGRDHDARSHGRFKIESWPVPVHTSNCC